VAEGIAQSDVNRELAALSSQQADQMAMREAQSQANLSNALANMYLGAYTGAQDLAGQASGQAIDLYKTAGVVDPNRYTTAASLYGQIPGMGASNIGLLNVPAQIGEQYRGYTQAGIDEAMDRWNYAQQQPWDTLGKYTSIIAGTPSGTTTTGPNPNAGSAAGSALGGAALGYDLFGSGLGSLGGALLFSDERLKQDIELVGNDGKYNWYEYQYVWGGPRKRGVMAQEVMAVNPDAVHDIGGYLAVDYGRL
jgi:hypothetical protein